MKEADLGGSAVLVVPVYSVYCTCLFLIRMRVSGKAWFN